MRKGKTLQIAKERKCAMVAEIKNYFEQEREEEIGDLAAGLLLDFITEKLAPEFYNQGVEDSGRYIKDAAEDLFSLRI